MPHAPLPTEERAQVQALAEDLRAELQALRLRAASLDPANALDERCGVTSPTPAVCPAPR